MAKRKTTKRVQKPNEMEWRNRIVGHAEVDPSKLKANPENWRTHPEQQQRVIAGAMKEVGWVQEIIVNKATGHIVDGHARVELAIKNNEKTVPVKYVNLSADEERKVLAILDPTAYMAGQDDEALRQLIDKVKTDDDAISELLAKLDPGEADDDEDEEPNIDLQAAAQYKTKWKTEKNQLWIVGDHRLYIGDSKDPKTYQRLLGLDQADMVYTDPPYGVSYEARSGKFKAIKNDALVGDKLMGFLVDCFTPMVKHTKKGAAFYIWHASSTRTEFADAMKAVGLVERQYLIWVKPAAVMGWGDYRWQHEPCFYAGRDGEEIEFYGDRTNSTVWYADTKNEKAVAMTVGNGVLVSDGKGHELFIMAKPPKNKKYRTTRLSNGKKLYIIVDDQANDIWHVGRERSPEHPTEKPTELARRALLNSSQESDIVLDIFAGSGRMMVAAEELGRRARLVELTPEYGAVILETAEKLGIKPRLQD